MLTVTSLPRVSVACVCLSLASALCLSAPMLLGVSLVPLCTTLFLSSLMRQWAALRDAALGLWPGPALELEGTRLAPILVDAQRS
jgi:hypothetical protein